MLVGAGGGSASVWAQAQVEGGLVSPERTSRARYLKQ
jgi:hypothetical protein